MHNVVAMYNCTLCTEINGGRSLHADFYPERSGSRYLIQERDWVVMPTIGPIVVGHILMVARRHVSSSLNSNAAELESGSTMLNRISKKISTDFSQDVVVFEHGEAFCDQKRAGACIDHAHLHVAPVSRLFVPYLQSQFDQWLVSDTLCGLREALRERPYILIGAVTHGTVLFLGRVCDGTIPSQYLRLQLAMFVGEQQRWNWRNTRSVDVFERTIESWNNGVQV